MSGQHLTDEELARRLQAYKEAGTYTGAAEMLGVTESNVRRSVRQATRRNLGGDFLGSPVPVGYTIGRTTTLVDQDGTAKLEWQHRHPDVEAVESHIDELIDTMTQSLVVLPEVPMSEFAYIEPDWLTVYPVVDVHLGLYAWAKESGANWDINIAKAEFLKSYADLINMSPYSEEALIVPLGDFFHADNNNAETERSHNHLDVDGRHDKVLHLGTELIIWMVDMALQKHSRVTIHVNRGNHDPYASKALGLALWFRYQGNPRVTVDRSPKDLWVYQWGKTMLAFTHGDKVKAEDTPGVSAAYYPEIWGATTARYSYSGHFHRNKSSLGGDERHGMQWNVLRAFTAKDEWNYSMGHASLREIISITFSKQGGRKFQNFVDVA